MSDWKYFKGGRCPVNSGTLVDVRNRYGSTPVRNQASNVNWSAVDQYRVVAGDAMHDALPKAVAPTVYVYGPQGCGKTRNAEALREFFGCTHVVDNDDTRAIIEDGALYLGVSEPDYRTQGNCRVLPFQYAMQLMAEGKPGLPTADLCPSCGRAGGEHDAVCGLNPSDKGTATQRHIGAPALNRTDFKEWRRETLERFARQAADENLILRERVFELEATARASERTS